MRTPQRRRAAAAAHAAVVAVRLSYEAFFVAAAAYLAYLFRRPAPLWALLIRLASALSYVCQAAVLYVFPVVCWAYGAGVVFSAFITAVFWGFPAFLLVEAATERSMLVVPAALFKPGAAALERMAGSCPICWDALPTAPPDRGRGSGATSGGDARAQVARAGMNQAAALLGAQAVLFMITNQARLNSEAATDRGAGARASSATPPALSEREPIAPRHIFRPRTQPAAAPASAVPPETLSARPPEAGALRAGSALLSVPALPPRPPRAAAAPSGNASCAPAAASSPDVQTSAAEQQEQREQQQGAQRTMRRLASFPVALSPPDSPSVAHSASGPVAIGLPEAEARGPSNRPDAASSAAQAAAQALHSAQAVAHLPARAQPATRDDPPSPTPGAPLCSPPQSHDVSARQPPHRAVSASSAPAQPEASRAATSRAPAAKAAAPAGVSAAEVVPILAAAAAATAGSPTGSAASSFFSPRLPCPPPAGGASTSEVSLAQRAQADAGSDSTAAAWRRRSRSATRRRVSSIHSRAPTTSNMGTGGTAGAAAPAHVRASGASVAGLRAGQAPRRGRAGQAGARLRTRPRAVKRAAAPYGCAPLAAADCADGTPALLACGHTFHFACASDWFHQCTVRGRPASCPVCQRETKTHARIMPRLLFSKPRRRGRARGDGEDDEVRHLTRVAPTCSRSLTSTRMRVQFCARFCGHCLRFAWSFAQQRILGVSHQRLYRPAWTQRRRSGRRAAAACQSITWRSTSSAAGCPRRRRCTWRTTRSRPPTASPCRLSRAGGTRPSLRGRWWPPAYRYPGCCDVSG
jgi:hypothetical protein